MASHGDEGERTHAELSHALGERVKELTILHAFARILQDDRPIDAGLLEQLARLLPPAWQYPEVCAGCIRLGEVEGCSPGFAESPWVQRASLTTSDGRTGAIEVAYREERPAEVEGPFLREERSLIDSLADMLRGHAERQTATAARRRAEEKFTLLFKAAPVGIALVDTTAAYRIIDVNDELERLLLHPRSEAIGKTTVEIGLWPDPTLRDRQLQRVLSAGSASGFEVTSRRRDGVSVPLRFSAQVLELDGAQCLLVAFVDVSEQKRAEASIRASEARLRRVIESPMLGFAFAGAGEVVHDGNDELLRLTGATRETMARGRLSFSDLANPAMRGGQPPPSLGAIAGGQPIEMEIARADGALVPVLVGASRVDEEGRELVAFLLDLTERRALQQRLQRAQRLEAVGRLAAGIAHDFNNFLSAITMSSELLRDELPPLHSASEYVTEIRSAAERAAGLTRQLLAFSRQQVMEPRVIALDVLVADLARMLARILGKDVALELRAGDAPTHVRADPSQIQQVILNLAVNARDAMSGVGSLTIETALELHERPIVIGDERLPAGRYVALHVTDTGVGIAPDIKARIFDPFFTTKESSRGTGLGLATVYGIVRQSGGAVDVESDVGRGARFRILFPAVEAAVEQVVDRAQVEETRGRETLLVVEDDALLRKMIRRSLEALGYTVIEAGSFPEAVDVAASHRGAIDLLLTDLVMPGGNGRVLAEQLVTARPALRAILMSGYTDDAVVRDGELRFAFIQKPFSSAELAGRIRQVLGAASG
jgi:two-component system cell cycle sensor histidine kinase/response regulator CckA